VYRSREIDGRYDRITVRNENTTYTDRDVVNGERITCGRCVHWNGHERAVQAAFDTPRPAGAGVVGRCRWIPPRPGLAGLDRSGFVSWWSNSDTDMYIQRIDGVLYAKGTLVGGYWNDIQDLGWTSSMDDVSWAPADGWSVAPTGVELIEGHTYVVWTHDSFFAKFRIADIVSSGGAPSAIVIDWAYQIDQDNPELKALPIRPSERVERGDA
jgi:hypothetical protein